MKNFMLFLLTINVVRAATHADMANKQMLLQEIITSVKNVENHLQAKIFVPEVITTAHCTPKSICKAGNVIAAFKAKNLGLKEEQWLLPRQLIAYTWNINCEDSSSSDIIKVELKHLLRNIENCAKQVFAKN